MSTRTTRSRRRLRRSSTTQHLTEPLRVTTTQGIAELRPIQESLRMMGASTSDLGREWTTASALRRARRTLEFNIPPETARAYKRVHDLFQHFIEALGLDGTLTDVIDPELTADFLMWRAAPPIVHQTSTDEIIPNKPPGHNDVVDATTAAGDLVTIRARWNLLGRPDLVQRTRGPQVDRVLRHLSARIRSEAVRKTPVPHEHVQRIAREADEQPNDPELLRDAAIINVGFHFMMRNGEMAIRMQDVIVRGSTTAVTFHGEKARGGRHRPIQPVPRTRWVQSSTLANLLRRYIANTRQNAQPTEPLFLAATDQARPVTANNVRRILNERLGKPKKMTASDKILPWSLRAGGATHLMRNGATPEEVRRLGRWTSETSLQYSVMGREAQLEIWRRTSATRGEE